MNDLDEIGGFGSPENLNIQRAGAKTAWKYSPGYSPT
jgi:hypothetical protein